MPKKVTKIKKKKEEKPKKAKEKKLKKVAKEKAKKEVVKKEIKKPAKYFEATGRRKTAIARVRLFTRGGKEFLVNERPYNQYFPTSELQQIALDALNKMKCLDHFGILVKIKGGGIHAQAEAIRHGIARALVAFNPDFRKRLRRVGYLTRDSRERERKKFGLKRARRAPQWQKR